MVDNVLLCTVLLSVLGSFTNVLMWIKSWQELTDFEATKTIALGFVVGILYYLLRVEHGFPDSIMSFVVGYASNDFLSWIIEKFGAKKQ